MKLTPSRLAVLSLAFAATGCGDTFPKLVQAEMSLVNEVADHMLKIVDEDTARHFIENYSEKIKDTWEEVQRRKDLFFKNSDLSSPSAVVDVLIRIANKNPETLNQAEKFLDNEIAEQGRNEGARDVIQNLNRLKKNREFLVETLVRHRREQKALQDRLRHQRDRLGTVIGRSQGQAGKLQEAREAPRRLLGDAKAGMITVLIPSQ
jgi:hypothetical protein